MEIRDTRNGEWHWVNNAVIACPHINPFDKVVYSALCTFAGCKEIRPSFELIAERASVSVRKAIFSINILIKRGYVLKITGGGRGKANIYQLLKVPKGCKLCIVSKGCKIRPETMQDTTINYASCAYQLDKELDKEINKDIILHSKSNDLPINELIKLFEPINPSYKQLYKNKTQRAVLERMLKEHGDKLTEMIKALEFINKQEYAPTTTTPLELEKNMGKLKAWSDRQKNKQIIKI